MYAHDDVPEDYAMGLLVGRRIDPKYVNKRYDAEAAAIFITSDNVQLMGLSEIKYLGLYDMETYRLLISTCVDGTNYLLPGSFSVQQELTVSLSMQLKFM